jgi:hypothetical protein
MLKITHQTDEATYTANGGVAPTKCVDFRPGIEIFALYPDHNA